MNVLFITSSRLGDAVLSTGLLDHIIRTYPQASITVACGPLPASLFDGMPNLKQVITLKKQKFHGHWFALWRQVISTNWDIVVDLRDSAVSRLIRAKKRYIFSKHIDKAQHKAEQAAAVMRLDTVPSPRIWVSEGQKAQVSALIPDGSPVLGVGPTANWIGKTWPAERFIEVIDALTAKGGILPGARVAVFAAPGEEEDARKVLASVPSGRQIDIIAKTDPGTAAAALQRCALYIGNDSGLMHCAAAASVPTVGLFGPSYPHLYRPWGTHATYISTPETYDELTDYEGYAPETVGRSLMMSLTVSDVISAVQKFWQQHRQVA